ncbi:hypothetical protein HY485_02150 [Candidatus Woesearchaeota archaeon]|nr:hypothetical protein [Candidatus Woesearchaeota archaeon]
MAKYNKIFWLEDMPDFLEVYFHETEQTGLKRDALLSRVTFAHDFEEGKLKVNGSYDLYILDADFPDVCEPIHRQKTEEYIDAIRNNKLESGKLLQCMDDTETNNFARFYRQFLAEKKSKVVVLSMSSLAPIVAFALNLPFYCKGGLDENECKADSKFWRGHIKREIEIEDAEMDRICAKVHVDRKSLELKLLENYECGSGIHFIQKYLL